MSTVRGSVAVAEHNRNGAVVGTVHRKQRGVATASRNRSTYRTRCGTVVYRGLPVTGAVVAPVCRRCFPEGAWAA